MLVTFGGTTKGQWLTGVGDGTDSTIGLDERVLTGDDISVTGLTGRLGVSGEGIVDGVTVVVLGVGVEGLDGLDDGSGLSIGDLQI